MSKKPGKFKKVLLWSVSKLLKAAKLYEPNSWRAGHAQGHDKGKDEGYKDGYDKGYGQGHIDGTKEGHQAGFEEGKVTLVINDKRDLSPASPRADISLTSHWKWPITDSLAEMIKSDFRAKLPKEALPTPSQWQMILSSTSSTYVIAGAGSGKSTSLVYRIVVLHLYLNVSLDKISVVTFTRASRFDFIDKLIKTLAIWGKTLTEAQAKNVVRTFHSMILKFAGALPGTFKAFEFINDQGKSEEIDNIFDTKVSIGQRDLLHEAYDELFKSNESFRRYVSSLCKKSLVLEPPSGDDPQLKKKLQYLKMAADRDKALTEEVVGTWEKQGLWPFPGIEPEEREVSIFGKKFLTNGRLPNSGILVVLGGNNAYTGTELLPNVKRPILSCLYDKKLLLSVSDCTNIRWIENINDAKSSVAIDEKLSPNSTGAPRFNFKISGELKAQPICEAFVSAANFIENMSLEVCSTIRNMKLAASSPDVDFFRALSIYWPHFQEHLETHGVRTFNRMFADFSERNSQNLKLIPTETLANMQHLMIDEFQDISPQIVSWVRAVMRETRSRGMDGSLMCVGDDWQSIYGWRGSSPHYFIDFEKEFPAHQHTKVILAENFRSHQNVIDCAEATLGPLKAKSNKPGGKASGTNSHFSETVKVLPRDEKLLADLIHHHHCNDSGSIKILYRKKSEFSTVNSTVTALIDKEKGLPAGKRRVETYTYHSSKGLQASTVFLLGDCVYEGTSPYKNEVYRIAGFKFSFDQAQADEAFRLAYVAVTRASKHCYWFLQGKQGASKHLPQAANYLDRIPPAL